MRQVGIEMQQESSIALRVDEDLEYGSLPQRSTSSWIGAL